MIVCGPFEIPFPFDFKCKTENVWLELESTGRGEYVIKGFSQVVFFQSGVFVKKTIFFEKKLASGEARTRDLRIAHLRAHIFTCIHVEIMRPTR